MGFNRIVAAVLALTVVPSMGCLSWRSGTKYHLVLQPNGYYEAMPSCELQSYDGAFFQTGHSGGICVEGAQMEDAIAFLEAVKRHAPQASLEDLAEAMSLWAVEVGGVGESFTTDDDFSGTGGAGGEGVDLEGKAVAGGKTDEVGRVRGPILPGQGWVAIFGRAGDMGSNSAAAFRHAVYVAGIAYGVAKLADMTVDLAAQGVAKSLGKAEIEAATDAAEIEAGVLE